MHAHTHTYRAPMHVCAHTITPSFRLAFGCSCHWPAQLECKGQQWQWECYPWLCGAAHSPEACRKPPVTAAGGGNSQRCVQSLHHHSFGDGGCSLHFPRLSCSPTQSEVEPPAAAAVPMCWLFCLGAKGNSGDGGCVCTCTGAVCACMSIYS